MRGVARCVVALAALAASVGLAPVAHAASPPSFVTMFSDGDYIGGGTQRRFDSTNAQISLNGGPADVSVGAAGGTAGDSYSFEFAAPPGQILVAGGVYVDAQRAPFREAGHAGIDIGGSGRGCNTINGQFEVKDIGVDPSGTVSRLWIVYEQHCEGGGAALWGEVKVGEPTSGGPLLAGGIVRWPATDVGRAATVVPVAVVAADGPVTVTGVSLTGAAASDFVVRSDECTGKSLTIGSACQVWVRFVPTVAGTRLAALRLTDGAGVTRDVALQGFAFGGRTRVDMTSDVGDYIGAGRKWSYTPANATISLGGSRSFAGFGINGSDGSWWSADFAPSGGDILVPGTYANATRYPFNGTGPGIDVTGNGRGCNTSTGSFTVTWADYAPSGILRSFGVTFEQHCEGATPALRGTFEFRAGDNTPLAPWMIAWLPPKPTVDSFAPASGGAGTTVAITGTNLAGATSVTIGGATASFTAVSATQVTATVPAAATTGRIAVTTPAGLATSATDFTVTASAPGSQSLIANGSFESDLSGWAGWQATATRVAGGADGAFAARVSFGGSGSGYAFSNGPRQVAPTAAGARYRATAKARSETPGRRLCLVVREWSSPSTVSGTGRSCLTATGSWQAFAPFTYTATAAGDSLELYVEQAGAVGGDSFDLDAVTLADAGSNLVDNGSFESDLAGWTGWQATAARVAGGATGAFSARVSFGGSGSGYAFTTSASPGPVTPTVAGASYRATAQVRSETPGRRLCLVFREWSAATAVVGSGRSCITATAAWQAFPSLVYTTVGSGGSLELYVEQGGAVAGDSFDLDAVSMVGVDSNLIGNSSFETDLADWATWQAAAARVAGGAAGGFAARVSFGGSGSGYAFTTSPAPVSPTVVGKTYQAGAQVRSEVPGRRLCLVFREWSSAITVAGSAGSCVTATGAWQAFPPLAYTTVGSGGTLELYVEQGGAVAGDSFDLDAVSFSRA